MTASMSESGRDGAVQHDGDKAFHADEIVFEFLDGIDVVLQHDLFSL